MPTSLDFHFSLPFLSYLTIRALELPVTLPSLSEYVTPTATTPSSEVTASALNISVLPKLKTLLKPEDIEVSMAQTEGFNCQRYNGVTIALDTTLTEDLLEEGFVREIISKVQTMRKENGFEVTDHIKVSLSGNDKLQALVQKNESYLKEITLADEVAYGTTDGTAKEWNINGENVTIAVK